MKESLTVYTGGTFDVPHRGHLDLLEWCRTIAGPEGEVYVALNTDEFVEEFKGKAPIIPFEDRRAILEAFSELVDYVIPNVSGADSKPTILQVGPDAIVIGSDWMKKDYCEQMNFTPEWLEEQNIALIYIPRHRNLSSSEIKGKIKNG